MREQRRARLAERQILLARIDRRDAMGALAGAIDEETKSAALAERSRLLIAGYGNMQSPADGQSLRDIKAMTAGLAQLEGEADKARDMAVDLIGEHSSRLAMTETRLKLLEQHARNARRAVSVNKQTKELSEYERVARKLLGRDQARSGTPT